MTTQWQFKIWARQKDAIGMRQMFVATVEADDEQGARLRLYDKYEHISVESVRQLDLASDDNEREE